MTALIIIAYLALGCYWWKRIAIAIPSNAQPEKWQTDLINADLRGDIALLVVKGIFVLFWPLALFLGWLSARLR
ncbi:hypothetical protein [Paracoccus sp. KR1-242]|uniref:hypothetical protein n=1 Tax=Paracoccus sp. KR1-242 TaxID=3410028 RepID=UPI003C10444F